VKEDALDYEQMLNELLGLIGTTVLVWIQLRYQQQARPLGILFGELRRGEPTDLSRVGVQLPPGDEAIGFVVGEAIFFMRRHDFKRGRRDPHDGALIFEAGRSLIKLGPVPEETGQTRGSA
jgi:hypothetical protein